MALLKANTGIGTTNPTSALHVIGDGRFTGVVTAISFSGTATTASFATTAYNLTDAANILAGTINNARLVGTYSIDITGNSGYATTAGIATYATIAGVSTYATSSGIATYATTAGIATYATSSGIATYATTAGIATYATSSGIATYATTAGVSTYATSSGIATYATSSGIATYATIAGVSTYSESSGIATYATTAGISTYATSSGIATYATIAGVSTYSESSGIATYATIAGVSTYATTAGIATYATTAGVSTYSETSGIATYATTAGVATALQTSRSISITGDVEGSVFFNGTSNVSIAATIQPNSVGLGTDTTGDYVQSITGTSNQITVTSGTGESSTPTLSIPSQFTVPQDITVTRDLQVNRNLNVNGNITLGGTTAFINVQELIISDPDIVLGYRTDAFGNDVSNDNTANHGGIALASTEGTPLISLYDVGIGETNPATYKKIMWFKSGTFSGLGTDAWLSNYAVGIGSTQFPTGTRLAAGAVQFTERDLAVVRNINASGIVTASSFIGNALSATYATSSGIATYATSSGIATYATIAGVSTYSESSGIATYATSSGIATYATSSGIATYSTTAGVSTYATSSGIATYATSSGIATYSTTAGVSTYATSSGIATNLTGGSAGSIPYQTNTGITSFTQVGTAGSVLLSGGVGAPYWGSIAGGINGVTINDEGVLVGSANSVSILNFVGPNITATASGNISTITVADYVSNTGVSTSVIGGIASVTQLSVTGVSTVGLLTATSIGIGTTNPTSALWVNGDGYFTGIITANRIVSSLYGEFTGAISGTDIVGTALSISGISTLGTVQISSGIVTATSGVVTYYGDGSKLTNIVTPESPVNFSNIVGTALSISGISTLGTVKISSGIVTATSGVVTYYGDGSKLSGVSAQGGISVADEGIVLGSGVTTLNFVGNNLSALAITNGIGTVTIADYVSLAGIATNLKGGLAGNIPYQSTTQSNVTLFLANGATGTILQSNGVGNAPSWVTAPPANAISGITVQEEGQIVGLANSISQFNFVGPNVTATASGSISTITVNAANIFDTTIDNSIYVQPTGTLDIVGVGTTTTQITTFPPGSSTQYIIHSIHVTNVSSGDAEVTAGFIMNSRKVFTTISVSAGYSGGAGIHTFTVGSASSITVGMAVTGTGNIGETTGIGATAGLQYNTYVTSVDGNNITLSKPMTGRATGTLYFSPVSKTVSRLPVPVGSAVELLKQPMAVSGSDSIVIQSTGAGSGIGSTSTFAVFQSSGVGILTVTAGAAITNFIQAGMLVQGTGNNTGIQTNTYVGVGYTPGSLSIPITRPAITALASTSISFTEVVIPEDGAIQATIVYQSQQDTSFRNGTGTVIGLVTTAAASIPGVTSTTPGVYYSSGSYSSAIQSIRVSNISDGSIYPAGDYPVSVGIGNSDTIFSYLAYNMIIPRNSSIELCESPKRLGIGQSIFAFSNTPGVIEIQIAGRQKLF
jgi:hypothetical protein